MPSSPNYVRNYVQERKTESAARKKQRSQRNQARAMMKKKLGAAAIKGKDIDHKKPLSQGGAPVSLANLRVLSPSANRSYARNKNGSIKSTSTKKKS